MCSINHEMRAVFIHIPKNGGSYLSDILSKKYGFKNHYYQRPDHVTYCRGKDASVDKHENRLHGTFLYYSTSPELNRRMGMTPEKWNSYFIFCFMRDPYERIVSGWNYTNKSNTSFPIYLHTRVNDYDYWHAFMPQTRHITDRNGEIRANFIGRVENMETDLSVILKKIGFTNIVHTPFKKNSKQHADYSTYYTPECIPVINKLFFEDFENGNYDMDVT